MINEKHIKQYCSEPLQNVENYAEAVASAARWALHHRLEIAADGSTKSRAELVAAGLYYRRPACELVFLDESTHKTLHNMNHSADWSQKLANANKRRVWTDAARERIADANKRRVWSEESLLKMSATRKGRPGPNKGRVLDESWRGKIKAYAADRVRAYREYRRAGGPLTWIPWLRANKTIKETP